MTLYPPRIWYFIWLFLILFGCKPDGLNLNIRYDQIDGLVKGDRVMFEQNHIGKVAGITYTHRGDYTVAVVIQKDFAASVTEYSRFYITDDPQREGHKAVAMIRIKAEEGTRLQNHTTIEGSTKASAFFEQMVGGFEKRFEAIANGFEQFVEELSQFTESEAFRNLEDQLKALSDDIKRAGQKARAKIRKQWLPQIEKELEKLRKRLREMGREDELKPLEVEFEKLKAHTAISGHFPEGG